MCFEKSIIRFRKSMMDFIKPIMYFVNHNNGFPKNFPVYVSHEKRLKLSIKITTQNCSVSLASFYSTLERQRHYRDPC
jgi:hypothetical protein